MHEIVTVPVADLLLNTRNPRIGKEQIPSQQAVYLELATQQGTQLIKLAEDIVNHGMDPLDLPGVMATGGPRKQYLVLEGNRRVLALKALETPTIVSGALPASLTRRLATLSSRYAQEPLENVDCVLFENEEEADHWIQLRHTGANEGVGLVGWDTNEQDRWLARRGARKPAGQVMDFVEKHGRLSEEARQSKIKIFTNVERLLKTPGVREKLGIVLVDGRVVSKFPLEEVTKGLSRVVEDLKTGRVKVPDLYHASDRVEYVEGLGRADLPVKSKALPAPVALDDLSAGRSKPVSPPAKRKPRKSKPARTGVIPRDSAVNPRPPRINAIYNELVTLSVETYPNASAVLLRVFLELSVDHEIERSSLMNDQERSNSRLSKRMKAVADHFHEHKKINQQLKKAIHKVADARDVIAASTTTFNQYVHNEYVIPKPSELQTAWDELEPFLEKIWP